MILPFINTNRYVLFVVFIITVINSGNVFSEQENKFYLPKKFSFIYWKCQNDLCNIYLKKADNKILLLLKDSPYPAIHALNKNLIKLVFSCGSPCNYTIFYDLKKGMSKSFEFVIAVDAKKKYVVVADGQYLLGYKIFQTEQKALFSVKRNWAPTAALYTAILDAKLVDDNLYIKYLEGENFNTKEELIHFKKNL